MKTLNLIFNELIKTDLIGYKEKESIKNHFKGLTNELDMFKICKNIEYEFCTDKFLKQVYKNLKIES